MEVLAPGDAPTGVTAALDATARRPRRRGVRALQAAVSAGSALVLLTLVLPQVTGATWAGVVSTLALVGPWQLAGLSALWLVGLWAYAIVSTAALPGLTRSQAMVLNLVGSGVSNLAPFGGAVGVAVTWAMVRQYGYRTAEISVFTLVTGAWNLIARFALPALGLGALVVAGGALPRPALTAAGLGALLCALLVAVVAAGLFSDRAAAVLGRRLAATARVGQRLTRRSGEVDVAEQLHVLRAATVALLRRRWAPLTFGMLAYLVLQGLLMWACLAVLGSDLGWGAVMCGYACGRLLTAVVLTPGGTGFAETGAAAVLVALGGAPEVTVAGVLLFSVFTYAFEIPGGAIGYGVHLAARRWRHPAGSR